MFHIVFESRGEALLSEAMDLDESLDGETVLIEDDYAVGPVEDLFTDAGRLNRMNWWRRINDLELLEPESEHSTVHADTSNLRKILQRMEEETFDQIWIWMAPNAKDVSGYYWIISQLQAFAGRIYLISLNNLPFISEKGAVFYPSFLHEIPAREFIKAKKLVRPVTSSEFELDPEEWSRLASENKVLRILESGKKIVQVPEDYYDQSIARFLQPVFQKTSRTVQQFLQKSPVKLNESFLNWRLKQLIAKGVAEQQSESIRLFNQSADQSITTV